MDRTLAGLIGAVGSAVGSLAAVTPAQAVTAAPMADVLHAASYADLLRPIPNATAALHAADANGPAGAQAPEVMQVQYYHHHHHGYYRQNAYRRPVYGYYHHHHHHYRRIFVPGVGWIVR